MKSIGSAFALCLAAGLPFAASAQTYPERSIRFVVSFPPGGSTDFIARILAQRLPAALGQSIVVDNRGGGGGNIGNDIVAKAAPDGYTMLITAEGTITINPSVYAKLPYDAIRDLPAVKELVRAGGSETSGMPPAETRAKVRTETDIWAKVVKSTGIKVE